MPPQSGGAEAAGPFAQAAEELSLRGLAVIPCPSEDGKSPAGTIGGFHNWRRRPGRQAVERMARRWPEANVGVITSLSSLTVVDVDGGSQLVRHVQETIGDTPLVTRTPSGGRHLWYKSNGERNANLRRLGLAVDIKGSGSGIVIVPPSFRPSTGVAYAFDRGNWGDLDRLPHANISRLTDEPRFHRGLLAELGERNHSLFRLGLREARHCDDALALRDVLTTVNSGFPSPLSDAEVERIAFSAWGYQSSGKNWTGGPARAVIPDPLFRRMASLAAGGDAMFLYAKLQLSHGARLGDGEDFVLATKAMSQAGSLGKWGAARIRRARNDLIGLGLIECTHKGGSRPGDPDRFRFKPSSSV